jgi:hypothetical protein
VRGLPPSCVSVGRTLRKQRGNSGKERVEALAEQAGRQAGQDGRLAPGQC